MPSFHQVMPVLKVAQMEQALAFYTQILGFSIVWQAPNDGGGENCMLSAGGTQLLLSTGAHLGEIPQFTGTLYFSMEGVSDFYHQIKDQVKLVWPLEEMPYGQIEFGIRDPDGYTLAFAEDAPPKV